MSTAIERNKYLKWAINGFYLDLVGDSDPLQKTFIRAIQTFRWKTFIPYTKLSEL